MYEKLRPANFMRCMLQGTGNLQATDLHSMMQVGTQAELDLKAESRAMRDGGMVPSAIPGTDWAKKFRMRRLIERRGDRGGMTMTAADGYVKE